MLLLYRQGRVLGQLLTPEPLVLACLPILSPAFLRKSLVLRKPPVNSMVTGHTVRVLYPSAALQISNCSIITSSFSSALFSPFHLLHLVRSSAVSPSPYSLHRCHAGLFLGFRFRPCVVLFRLSRRSTACSTNVNVEVQFGSSSNKWSIAPPDFTFQELEDGSCLGSFFELPANPGTTTPPIIMGDTFLVSTSPLIYLCLQPELMRLWL